MILKRKRPETDDFLDGRVKGIFSKLTSLHNPFSLADGFAQTRPPHWMHLECALNYKTDL